MTTKNNIPAGYKDSAVGIIPQEWEVKTFQECFHISAGRDLQKEYYSEKQTLQYQYPIFSNSLENRGLYGYTSNPRHKAGSITITGRGMLGVAEYRDVDFDAIVRLLVLYPKKEIAGQVVTEYINYRKPFYFESTGVPQLTAPQISNIPIPVPPLAEQRKIAEILGVWDEAIEKQSRLIEKLELRKRALMQRLLTGRTRLPGFTTPWQKCLYSDILKEVKRTMSWDDNEEYDLISVKRRSGGLFYRERLYGRDIKTKNLRPAKCGDFLISKMQIVHGASGLVTDEFDGMKISGSYIALVAKNSNYINMDFINWYSKTPYFYHQTYVSSYGVHIEKMTFDLESFMSMNVMLPPLPEQKAIAEVLTAADDEIATHRKKLDALRLQKRGLMQQLLTGKTRVKI
ncbi:MAG: restriction endonuclease subunit S [Alistipes sp.]|nr:restriction endonuclease subunit S [Alistipes sp.]